MSAVLLISSLCFQNFFLQQGTFEYEEISCFSEKHIMCFKDLKSKALKKCLLFYVWWRCSRINKEGLAVKLQEGSSLASSETVLEEPDIVHCGVWFLLERPRNSSQQIHTPKRPWVFIIRLRDGCFK